MFEKIIAASKRASSGGVETRYDEAEESISHLLLDDERIRHAIVTTKSMEHTKDDRKITIDAGSGHHVIALATNRRVLFLVGGQEEVREPDVAFDLKNVTEAEYRNSLLSTSVYVAAEGESIDIPPSEGAPERFVSYVDRISSNWADLEAALDDVREAMTTFERRSAEGSDTQAAVADVQSALDRARDVTMEYIDAPDDLMNAEIDRLADEFEALRTDSRVQSIEERIDSAKETDDYETACERLREATEELAATRSAVDDEDVHAALDDAEAKLEEVTSAFLDAAKTAREEAREADAIDAVERYDDVRERFGAAASVADSVEIFDAADVQDRYRAVTSELYEALEAKADHLEEAGDEAGDDVDDEYQRAKAALERAQDLADHLPDADPAEMEDDLARLDEAVERSKWEWGQS